MQALKGLVIFMAVLIVIGVVVVGVTIYRRATDMWAERAPLTAATSETAPPAAGVPGGVAQNGTAPQSGSPLRPGVITPEKFGVRELDLPSGSTILAVQGVGDRVLLHARQPDGRARILILDPISGEVTGEWRASGGDAVSPPPPPVQPLSPDSPGDGAGSSAPPPSLDRSPPESQGDGAGGSTDSP